MSTDVSLPERRTIRLVLANMSMMHADLLRTALREAEDVAVAGHVASLGELAVRLEKRSSDVVLIGAETSRDSSGALGFLRRSLMTAPAAKPIVMSAHLSREDVELYLRSGARGLLSESESDLAMLTTCVRCVSMGQIWASAAQLGDLLHRDGPAPQRITNVLGVSLLSSREEQVLELLASGLSNRELAAVMKLSEHTVKNHLFRIFDKLGVSNRLEAVLYAVNQRERRAAPAAPDGGGFPRQETAKVELATRCHSSRSHLRTVRANEC